MLKQQTSSYTIIFFLVHFDFVLEILVAVHKEGRSQRLNKKEPRERNQDKNAIAADS